MDDSTGQRPAHGGPPGAGRLRLLPLPIVRAAECPRHAEPRRRIRTELHGARRLARRLRRRWSLLLRLRGVRLPLLPRRPQRRHRRRLRLFPRPLDRPMAHRLRRLLNRDPPRWADCSSNLQTPGSASRGSAASRKNTPRLRREMRLSTRVRFHGAPAPSSFKVRAHASSSPGCPPNLLKLLRRALLRAPPNLKGKKTNLEDR
mmetsp:Transcript_9727/g.31688  ORF Transcript_9727/g.31688 Transcript_9727/m.31688 type:complete len:203 (-) Transcript_9727:30-638(-)